VEARRETGGEQLLGVGGVARAAQLLGAGHGHVELAVVGVDPAVPAAVGGGGGGVEDRFKHGEGFLTVSLTGGVFTGGG
jgi:hypothetical protein